jgi:hypothetical protein
MSQLALDIIPTMNPSVMRIADASNYTVVPTNPILTILGPGYTTPGVVNPTSIPFLLNLSVYKAGLMPTPNPPPLVFPEFPDGVYVVKYSINPNTQVFVEYNHLRVVQFMNQYQKALCKIDNAGCMPSAELEEDLKKLRLIDNMVKAAVAQVEICGKRQAGLLMFQYASKLLDRFTCKSCK